MDRRGIEEGLRRHNGEARIKRDAVCGCSEESGRGRGGCWRMAELRRGRTRSSEQVKVIKWQ